MKLWQARCPVWLYRSQLPHLLQVVNCCLETLPKYPACFAWLHLIHNAVATVTVTYIPQGLKPVTTVSQHFPDNITFIDILKSITVMAERLVVSFALLLK